MTYDVAAWQCKLAKPQQAVQQQNSSHKSIRQILGFFLLHYKQLAACSATATGCKMMPVEL